MDFLTYFEEKYEDTFTDIFLVNRKKANVFTKRIMGYGKPEEVLDITEFLFDNWDRISKLCGIKGNLTLNILATYSFFEKFRGYFRNGIPINSKDRFIDGPSNESF